MNWVVTKPSLFLPGIASMDHATLAAALLATPFAAALGPLTLRLLPVISRIGQLIVSFRAAELTPSACHQFETQLHDMLRELGRIIVEWTYNHLESDDRSQMPDHLLFDGDWFRRRDKTPNRRLATLFGAITLWRYLYQPVHGVERSIFPLEIRLGLAAGHATPALADRVAHAATDATQSTVLAALKRDQGVAWSVETLRLVIATTWPAYVSFGSIVVPIGGGSGSAPPVETLMLASAADTAASSISQLKAVFQILLFARRPRRFRSLDNS